MKLRTKSKKTPRVRGRPPNVREGCPTISLEDTKIIIGDNLLRDERKIKYRNPKRHVLSEEEWGEGKRKGGNFGKDEIKE